MRPIAWCLALLAAGCVDFNDAELEFCATRLDLCPRERGQLDDALRFEATLSPRGWVGREDLAGSTLASGTVAVLLDGPRHRIGYHFSSFGLDNSTLGFHRGGIGTISPARLQVTERVGVIPLGPDEVELLARGELYFVAEDGSGASIRGQVLPRNAELAYARLTGAEAVPNSESGTLGHVSLVFDHATRRLHVTAQERVSPPLVLGLGAPGFPSTSVHTIEALPAELEYSNEVQQWLGEGRLHLRRPAGGPVAQEVRGHVLFPGQKVAIARMTSSQLVAATTSETPDAGTVSVVTYLESGGGTFYVDATDSISIGVGVAGSPEVSVANLGQARGGYHVSSTWAEELRARLSYAYNAAGRGQFLAPGERLSFASLHLEGAGPGTEPSGGTQVVISPGGARFRLTGRSTVALGSVTVRSVSSGTELLAPTVSQDGRSFSAEGEWGGPLAEALEGGQAEVVGTGLADPAARYWGVFRSP
jgi:hypothetical protein